MIWMQARFRFDDFEVDVGHRLLRSVETGETVPLTPRVFDTLLVLVEHAGEIVDKRTLLEAVWPNVVVEENNLTQAISTLRKALGERAGEQRYIVTVPGRGYRFVAGATAGAAARPLPVQAGRPSRLLFALLFLGVAILGVAYLIQRYAGAPDEPVDGALLSNHQRVTVSAGNHGSPVLSPDGTRIAFVSDRSGTPQIWVKNLSFGDAVQLTSGPEAKSAPSWSIDDRILYTRHREDGAPVAVDWIDTQGTLDPTTIIEPGGHGSYSNDGAQIVFERGFEIWMADADGTNQRRIDGVPRRNWVFAWTYPVLSPDGQWIAFYLQAVGILGDIWIVPASGGTARPLTQERQHTGKPIWGPDGRFVYFSSRRGGTWNLWRVSVDGGAIEAVTSGVGEDREPAISRDGSILVYQNTRTSTTFRLLDPETGATESIESDGHLSWFPNVSNDGTRFVYFSELAPR
jgi:Tol biopolymer transport system component/DNA-binding winged helix-turn-helix (wHTH) protein